jgi:hypothetical protein
MRHLWRSKELETPLTLLLPRLLPRNDASKRRGERTYLHEWPLATTLPLLYVLALR